MSSDPPSTCRKVSWTQTPIPSPTSLHYLLKAEVAIPPTGPANGCNERGGWVFGEVSGF